MTIRQLKDLASLCKDLPDEMKVLVMYEGQDHLDIYDWGKYIFIDDGEPKDCILLSCEYSFDVENGNYSKDENWKPK